MRYTGPKAKKARRLGMAFTPKDAKVLQKRNFAPGQHGQNRVRLSEYGLQLREKQKAKIAYGVMERQFETYFNKALKQVGVTGDNLLKMLDAKDINQAKYASARAILTSRGALASKPNEAVVKGAVKTAERFRVESVAVERLPFKYTWAPLGKEFAAKRPVP
jgi:hypothetical protein